MTEFKDICPIILAAGKGTRMENPNIPKPFNVVGSKKIIDHIIHNISESHIQTIPRIVIGHMGEMIISHIGCKATYTTQEEQLGTGHAVLCALNDICNSYKHIIILNGDHPFIFSEVLNNISISHINSHSPITIGTRCPKDGFKNEIHLYNYGRIIRDKNNIIKKITELKDTTNAEKEISEVNVGLYCINTEWLRKNIELIDNKNNSGEYYLTDIVELAIGLGESVNSFEVDFETSFGINTKEQLEKAEKIFNNNLNQNDC